MSIIIKKNMLNEFDYTYKTENDFITVLSFNNQNTDTFLIPKFIGKTPIKKVLLDDKFDYSNIKKIIISADLDEFYLHSKTFTKLEKIVFEEDFDGSAEFVRNFVALWSMKNIKYKTTLPEIVFNGTPSKFKIKQHLLLSNDEKNLLAALTRESFAIPKSVETVCSKAILPTYKKTSVITYHSGLKTIENNPFAIDPSHTSLAEYVAPQMNFVPLDVENIGTGLLVNLKKYFAWKPTNFNNAHFLYDGEKLIIRTRAKNITDEALKEITELNVVSMVEIGGNNCPFEIKNDLLIYKKDTLVRAIRKMNNRNPIYIPDYIKKSFIDGVKAENKTRDALLKESEQFSFVKVDFITCSADMFEKKQYAWMGPDIKVPLTNMFKLKEPISAKTLDIKLADLKIPPTRKKEPDYGFAIDESCRYIEELVLPEGLTDFAIAKNLDSTSFALRKLVLPSTLAISNILPKLNQFKNLMIVCIKPSKKIQVKFGGLHFIVANLKKKKFDSLFFTYSYAGIDPEFQNPYSSGSYGGITYVSGFKEENLKYIDNGYYYLEKDETGRKYYLFLKTDFVDKFSMLEEIDGIKVEKQDSYSTSNISSK